MKQHCLFLALGIALAAAACSHGQQGGPARELKIHAHAPWPYAKVNVRLRDQSDALQLVIRSAEELVKASPHKDLGLDDAKPRAEAEVAKALGVQEIDWSKSMLVVISTGTQFSGGTSVRITSVKSDGLACLIAWTRQNPGLFVTNAVIHPSAVVLVDRAGGPDRFVSNMPAVPPPPGK